MWKLKKSLYGLHESGHQWHKLITTVLETAGLKRTYQDPCLYVDDALIFGETENKIEQVVIGLKKHFEVHDMAIANRFLKINITREGDQFMPSQTDYITRLGELFHIEESKNLLSPLASGIMQSTGEATTKPVRRSLLGALSYLSCVTRPDIAACVNMLCRQQDKPSQGLWKMARQVS